MLVCEEWNSKNYDLQQWDAEQFPYQNYWHNKHTINNIIMIIIIIIHPIPWNPFVNMSSVANIPSAPQIFHWLEPLV